MYFTRFSVLLTTFVLGFAYYATDERLQLIRFFTTVSCAPNLNSNQSPYYNYSTSGNITSEVPAPGFQSYCVTRGAWRVEHSWLQNENDFVISIGDGCTECHRARATFRYGNIKFLGGKDLALPYFSLYTDRNFLGKEVPVAGNEYTLEQTARFMSFAFNSYSNWTWQTYEQPRFRGRSMCHRPNVTTEVSVVPLTSINVGSVRLGCRNSADSPESRNIVLLIGITSAILIPVIGILL